MMRCTDEIAVVGTTGAVGSEALAILASRGHDAGAIRCFASARSAGTRVPYAGRELPIKELAPGCFAGVKYAVFSAGASVSKAAAPRAVEEGAIVIDNSSAFRLDAGVPLVVPEVNGEELRRAPAGLTSSHPRRPRIIANPNCSAIILVTAVNPLRRAFGVERIVVSTYQAVSGAGAAAMEELREQAGRSLRAEPLAPRVFQEPCAFNVFSHNAAVDPGTGVNGEERKMIDETRKIWNDPRVRISPTCVRVPVMRAHAEAVTVELGRSASEAEVRAALVGAPGVDVIDDRARNAFPTPLKAAGRDAVAVGRIRPDPCEPIDAAGRCCVWSLFVCGDQLRKGAALNAIQIADLLARE